MFVLLVELSKIEFLINLLKNVNVKEGLLKESKEIMIYVWNVINTNLIAIFNVLNKQFKMKKLKHVKM